jgi:hypothetical protein
MTDGIVLSRISVSTHVYVQDRYWAASVILNRRGGFTLGFSIRQTVLVGVSDCLVMMSKVSEAWMGAAALRNAVSVQHRRVRVKREEHVDAMKLIGIA